MEISSGKSSTDLWLVCPIHSQSFQSNYKIIKQSHHMVLRNDKSDIPVERHDQHIISCSHPGYLECRFGPNTFHESKSWRLSMRDLSFIDPALLTFHTSTCSISSMYRSEGGEMACQIVSCAGRILQEFATCSMSSWRIIDTSK